MGLWGPPSATSARERQACRTLLSGHTSCWGGGVDVAASLTTSVAVGWNCVLCCSKAPFGPGHALGLIDGPVPASFPAPTCTASSKREAATEASARQVNGVASELESWRTPGLSASPLLRRKVVSRGSPPFLTGGGKAERFSSWFKALKFR